MSPSATPDVGLDLPFCSIQRALNIVGERWTFLILREVLIEGKTKFAELEKLLQIAPNVLSDRLNTLVNGGILEKREYREEGSRPRASYHATPEGLELKLVLAALQQWGDEHVPPRQGVSQLRVTENDQRPVRVAFVDADNKPREVDEIAWVNTEHYPYEFRAAKLAAK